MNELIENKSLKWIFVSGKGGVEKQQPVVQWVVNYRNIEKVY